MYSLSGFFVIFGFLVHMCFHYCPGYFFPIEVILVKPQSFLALNPPTGSPFGLSPVLSTPPSPTALPINPVPDHLHHTDFATAFCRSPFNCLTQLAPLMWSVTKNLLQKVSSLSLLFLYIGNPFLLFPVAKINHALPGRSPPKRLTRARI